MLARHAESASTTGCKGHYAYGRLGLGGDNHQVFARLPRSACRTQMARLEVHVRPTADPALTLTQRREQREQPPGRLARVAVHVEIGEDLPAPRQA